MEKRKLSNEAVLFIRNNSNQYSQRALAKLFNVTKNTIVSVINNKRYKDI